MKSWQVVLYAVFLVTFSYCQTGNGETSKVSEGDQKAEENPSGQEKPLHEYAVDGKRALFFQLDSTEFFRSYSQLSGLEDRLRDSNPTKNDGCYVISTENGESIELCDQAVEEYEDDAVQYIFQGVLKGFPYLIFEVKYYEGGDYLLVHRDKGSKALMSSIPVASPDHKRMIAYNEDLEAGYTFNGLEMFRVEEEGLVSEWKLMLDEWGPVDLYWKADGEIRLKARYLLESGEERFEYYRMEVEDMQK